jgi:hypothetical protein
MNQDAPIIGLAIAGHAFRASGNDKKAEEYDNPLTDFINLMIAEYKAKNEIKALQNGNNAYKISTIQTITKGATKWNSTRSKKNA